MGIGSYLFSRRVRYRTIELAGIVLIAVLWIRIRIHFGGLDPDPDYGHGGQK
jgi:hypothetical protein